MDREELLDVLRGFAKRLREALGDAEVYLFGSWARGDWLEDSDVDIVVVSRGFEGLDIGRRYLIVRRLLPHHIGFDILAYTPEEFEEARRRSVILLDASEYWVRIDA